MGPVLCFGSLLVYLIVQAPLVNPSDLADLVVEGDDRLVGTAFSFQVARGVPLFEHQLHNP